MSGLVNILQRDLAATANEVSIQVGKYRFRPWKQVAVTRGCESMPNSWTVSGSTDFLDGPAGDSTRPGQACDIYIDEDKIITGWIDRRSLSAVPRGHNLTLTGRGITRNLVDCSADLINDKDLRGGMISAPNVLGLAQQLCKSFKITARSAVKDLGIPIPSFSIGLGETPYEIIESAARYAGFLVYEDENGQLVLDRVSGLAMASGFSMPGNIESIHVERSVDQRFSSYLVVYNTVAGLTDLGALANQRFLAKDATMTEFRPKIIVSAQLTPAFDVGERRAKWELARRIGRSQVASIRCGSWRDGNGKLWQPNRLAPIEAPKADVTGARWTIGTVTFVKDHNGTHADLILMPPDAFNPEPNPLNLFNAELMQSPRVPDSPAPPATAPGGP